MPKWWKKSGKSELLWLFLILTIFLSCSLSKSVRMGKRDNIYLKSGEEYAGELIEWRGDTLFFRTQDSILRFHSSLISSIDRTRKRKGDSWVIKDDIDDPLLKKTLNQKEEEWYQEGGYVVLLRKREFSLSEDGRITEETRVINRVLKERGKSIANQRFTYLSSTETARLLFARGITEKGDIVSIRENAIEDAPYFRNFLLYNELRQKKFAIPESRIGSFLDYSYSIVKKSEPKRPFFASLNFAGWQPTKVDSVILNFPIDKKILYKTEGLPEPEIKRTKKCIKYVWVLKNEKGRKKENLAPPFKDIFPRLTFADSMSWQDVDLLLSSSIKDSLIYTEKILQRLENIKSQETSIILDSLYNLVCKEIRFAPVPLSATIPVPKTLKTVYKTKYANSLDKTYFLYGLLKKSGIQNYIVLTRSKEVGRFVKEVPSPQQFTYALLLVIIDGDSIFLDPREDTYTKGYISEEIQGEKGLVLGTEGEFVRIPLQDNEKKTVEMSVNIKADGSCEIKKSEELGGKYGINFRRLKEMKEEEIRKRLEEDVSLIYPGAKLIDYVLSPLTDLTREVTLSVRYRIKNFAFLAGDFLFVTLPEIDYSAASVGASERKLPLFFNTYNITEHRIEFVFPDGFSVYHIGRARNFKKDFITFSSEFSYKDNKVVYRDYFKRKALLLDPSKYEDYKTCLQVMAEVTNEIIVLKRK